MKDPFQVAEKSMIAFADQAGKDAIVAIYVLIPAHRRNKNPVPVARNFLLRLAKSNVSCADFPVQIAFDPVFRMGTPVNN